MKTVVMIAHAFPPEGSAGVYRPLRFARHLPTMGWLPSVISAATDSYERYDPELLELVPTGIEVSRVPSRDPWQSVQRRRAHWNLRRVKSTARDAVAPSSSTQQPRIRSVLREVVRRAEAWLYHPDMAMGWIQPAAEATVEMIGRKRPQVIWTTAGPISSFLVAQRASERTGIPYVLDFRDAWTITYNEFDARRPAWATRSDRRALYRLLRGARAVTFRYHAEAECYWRAYPGALDAFRIHIIPNGYEGPIEASPPPGGDRCIVLYAGTLASYRYDTLLQALCLLKRVDRAQAARLRLVVVGEGAKAVGDEAAALGLGDLVAVANPISHQEVIRLQREAHALLVLGRPPSMKGYELFAGAKLFGYLRAGRPILGVLPPDETRKVLNRVGVSTVADGDSPPEIVAALRRLLDAWSSRTLSSLLPDRGACEVYSAESQTAALVRVLEGKTAMEPFVPNSVEIPPSLREHIRSLAEATIRPPAYPKRDSDAILHSGR